ncbi:MAG: hemolysin family protein [Candidatus Sericytochromatia bacterium]
MLWELGMVLLLILLNGLFSMSEIALISVRQGRLKQRAEHGHKRACKALALAENPTAFLSTIQIGLTLIGLLTGVYGGTRLSERLSQVLISAGMPTSQASPLAIAGVVGSIAFATLVLGELVPKRIAMHHAERVSLWIAPVMQGLAQMATPLIWLLSATTHGILSLLGLNRSSEPNVSPEEIKELMAEGLSSGSVEAIEQDIVQNMFHWGDHPISALMVPRAEVICLEVGAEPSENLQRMRQHHHSAYPVKLGEDEPWQLFQLKSCLEKGLSASLKHLKEHLEPLLQVPASSMTYEVLAAFQAQNCQYAAVCANDGSVIGLVTRHDLLQAFVDEPLEESPEGSCVQRADGSWLLDGHLSLEVLRQQFAELIPRLDKTQAPSLAAFVQQNLANAPHTGERLQWDDSSLEIVDMDGPRIDKILYVPAGASLPDT